VYYKKLVSKIKEILGNKILYELLGAKPELADIASKVSIQSTDLSSEVLGKLDRLLQS